MSPLKMFQASCNDKKQGIVAVLSSDSERSKFQPSSLRRTLSADMSSHKWISQMKKVASFQDFGKEKTEDETEDTVDDVWSSIIKSQKDCFVAAAHPYVHPLAKRSGNCLNEKSLEICTESLGSETGSDGFSSNPSSENGDSEDDGDENIQGDRMKMFEVEDQWMPVKRSYKKSPELPRRRSFPPPLPTLSGPDGETLRVQPRRDNGRLVLEAMSVPSQNNFRAQREDGRLLLTLVNPHPIVQVEENDYYSEEEEKVKDQKMAKKPSSDLPNGLLNGHRLASMMNNNKSIVLANRNPSLPPRPKAAAQPIISYAALPAAAATLNTYEYYWRSKVGATMNPLGRQQQQQASLKTSSRKVMICKNRTPNEEHKLVVMSSSNGSCKEMRRTVGFWEPRCIPTS